MTLVFNEAAPAAAIIDDFNFIQEDSYSTVAVPAHRRVKGGLRLLPKVFLSDEIIHDIDEGGRQCSFC